MEYKGYFYIMSRQTGMVLDVFEGNTTASTLIVYTKKTEGAENQLWKYNSGTGELVSRLNGYRVDVSGAYAFDGAKIIIYPTNNAANQNWVFKPDGSIQSGLGHQWVLDVEGANTTAGTNVILYQRKEGGPAINQQWDIVPYVPTTGFYIRSGLNDLYLQIKDGSDKMSAPLCIGNRPGVPRADQKYLLWKYNKEDRTIRSELNGYAIEVQGGSAENFAKIIADPHHGGANQQWTFENSGTIVTIVSDLGENWVLTVYSWGGTGSNVILYNRQGGENKQWYISED